MILAILRRREWILALVFFSFCFAVIYPELFFLKNTPMGAGGWTLKDPTVSWSAFMPAFREFRYELFENLGVLWSNLRAMGQPTLGNAVQGAPLYPLNLALIWLPDQLYWSVMPVSRIILIALASFLIARKLFGLSFFASLLFALLAGFNLNVIRWINHPWSNGLLAGLWYLYFMCRVIPVGVNHRSQHSFALQMGLIVSVFAMITAGFPEASALAALMSVTLFAAYVTTHWRNIRPVATRSLKIILVCHLIGFCLSSVQIFALLEYISFSGALDLRDGFIGGTYNSDQALSYSLAQFSVFWMTGAQQAYLSFSIGLFGLFFTLRGLLGVWWDQKPGEQRRALRVAAVAFLAMMTLFVVKTFGLSDLVEWVFASTPILAQSHFPLYFSPLFYFGVAFFAAAGIQGVLGVFTAGRRRLCLELLGFVVFLCAGLLLTAYSVHHFNGTKLERLLELQITEHYFPHLRAFALVGSALVLIAAALLIPRANQLAYTAHSKLRVVLGMALIAGVLTELTFILPGNFLGINNSVLFPTEQTKEAIYSAMAAAPEPRHELRGRDANGSFVGLGLATPDNGVSAILPGKLREMRLALFETKFGGYTALEKPLKPWSWHALSNNVISLHATPKVNINWSDYSRDDEIKSEIVDWNEKSVSVQDSIYFEGRSWGYFIDQVAPELWLEFRSDDERFWVKANVINQSPKGFRDGRYRYVSNWRIRLPLEWLPGNKYDLVLRQSKNNSYSDSQTVTLNLERDQDNSDNLILLASSNDNKRHIYFDREALPRAYTASGCEMPETQAEAMQFFTRDNAVMTGMITINPQQDIDAELCEQFQGQFAKVSITSDTGSRMRLQTVTGPALLVINDSFYPGWTANDLNSKQQLTIIQANSAIRAIHLPDSKDYEIQLVYKPWWLPLVYGLLFIAILLLFYLHKFDNSNKLDYSN